MRKLTEKHFAVEKEEILNGRLSMPNALIFLCGIFVYSGAHLGFSFAAANANTVGWDTLSPTWHLIFYIEGFLLGFLLLILILCWRITNFNQKVLSVAVVIFTYNAGLIQYLTMVMLSKDRGMYESYIPLIVFILISGLIIHIIVLRQWIKNMGKRNLEAKPKRRISKTGSIIPVIFLLVIIAGIIMKNGLLDEYELMFGMFIFTVVYFGMLIGVCEFIIACYCIFRFPSFSVNAPKRKNVQHTNNKKNRKKNRNRNRR